MQKLWKNNYAHSKTEETTLRHKDSHSESMHHTKFNEELKLNVFQI